MTRRGNRACRGHDSTGQVARPNLRFIAARWGGYAAPKMAERLKEKGWAMTGEPGGFFVRGLKKGPLKRGEAERAAAWAKSLVNTRT